MNFELSELFYILVIAIYIAFGLFSFFYALNTSKEQIENADYLHKGLYYHGVFFMIGYITLSILTSIAYRFKLFFDQ